MQYDNNITFAFTTLLLVASGLLPGGASAAQPVGQYILGGNGTVLITFDGAGNFSGTAALPTFGIVKIQGNAPVDAANKIAGVFTLSNPQTNGAVFSGSLTGSATPGNAAILLRLATRPSQQFRGGPRTGVEPVPGGQYFRTQLPTSLLFQCDRSSDRQTVTLQGDQDFGLDLTQAVGGQLLFNQNGDGFGVVYENSNAASPPRWASAHYGAGNDQLRLTLGMALIGGRKSSYVLLGAASVGKYDGIYLVNIAEGDCAVVQVKITVKFGVISGSDPNVGTIAGTLDDSGNVAFTTQRLIEPVGCSQSGTHTGTVTFTGTPILNPVFPAILNGTFSGAGTSGTFVVSQPAGITGATTPGNLSHAENWTGTFSGTHDSGFCPGGTFAESFTISLSFPSSLISALRGKSQILSGSGNVSGAETVQTQAPLATAVCSLTPTASEGGSVNITFAGRFNDTQPSIEFDSTTVLIANTVHVNTGANAGINMSENRRILKFRVSFMTATRVQGSWADGPFILTKQ